MLDLSEPIPVPSTVERVTTTSFMRIAVDGRTVIVTHTTIGGSLSTIVTVSFGTANDATEESSGMQLNCIHSIGCTFNVQDSYGANILPYTEACSNSHEF